MAFKITRVNKIISIDGFSKVKFDWSPKHEYLSPEQVGIGNFLLKNGYSGFSGRSIECKSEEIAKEVEQILINSPYGIA
jgi:hypothetical protein